MNKARLILDDETEGPKEFFRQMGEEPFTLEIVGDQERGWSILIKFQGQEVWRNTRGNTDKAVAEREGQHWLKRFSLLQARAPYEPEESLWDWYERCWTQDCPHLSGYWIDQEAGRFRCYDCQYQVNLADLAPSPDREIEPWEGDDDDDWEDDADDDDDWDDDDDEDEEEEDDE